MHPGVFNASTESPRAAERWGNTAVAFIASATVTGVCALLAYALQPMIPWLAGVCCAIAILVAFVFLSTSLTIVKYWIQIAKRSTPPG